MMKKFSCKTLLMNSIVFFTFCSTYSAQQSPKVTSKTEQAQQAPCDPNATFDLIETVKQLIPHSAQHQKPIGTAYPLPQLPEQTATAYHIFDVKTGFSHEQYVLGLIQHGTFKHATSENPKMPGWNSVALLNLVTAMVDNLQKSREEQLALLDAQRKRTLTDSNHVALLLSAINSSPEKLVDITRVKAEFERIKEERKKALLQVSKILQEFYQQDCLKKQLLKQLSEANSGAKEPLPVSPTQPFPDFTKALSKLPMVE